MIRVWSSVWGVQLVVSMDGFLHIMVMVPSVLGIAVRFAPQLTKVLRREEMSSWTNCEFCKDTTPVCRCDEPRSTYTVAEKLREKAERVQLERILEMNQARIAHLLDLMNGEAADGKISLTIREGYTFGKGDLLINDDLVAWAKTQGIKVVYDDGWYEEGNMAGSSSHTFSW
jgi:hypothetical protein